MHTVLSQLRNSLVCNIGIDQLVTHYMCPHCKVIGDHVNNTFGGITISPPVILQQRIVAAVPRDNSIKKQQHHMVQHHVATAPHGNNVVW